MPTFFSAAPAAPAVPAAPTAPSTSEHVTTPTMPRVRNAHVERKPVIGPPLFGRACRPRVHRLDCAMQPIEGAFAGQLRGRNERCMARAVETDPTTTRIGIRRVEQLRHLVTDALD